MNEEELFCKLFPEYAVNGKPLSPYFDLFESGYEQSEKRIEELIDLIHAERKRQEQCDDIHLKKIAELEKENAELRDKLALFEEESNSYGSGYKQDQLTNAKDILKQWLQTSKASGCDNINIVTDTELFLNSEVEK